MTGRKITRIIRADTPTDVAIAVLIARAIPAERNILVYSVDKILGDRSTYRTVMEAVAGAHRWDGVVDVSGLSINERWRGVPEPTSRLALARRQKASTRALRAKLLSATVPLNPDEVLVTCLNHPDILMFQGLFPTARHGYYPHTFGSVDPAESLQYAAVLSPDTTRRRGAKDLLRRLVVGRDSPALLSARLDVVYSFTERGLGAAELQPLPGLVNGDSLRSLLACVPRHFRDEIERVRQACGERTVLVLLFPNEDISEASRTEEKAGLHAFVTEVVARERADTVMVKPHPRGDGRRLPALLDGLSACLDVDVVCFDRHPEMPVELLAADLPLVAVAGIGSSAVPILRDTLGVPAYVAADLFQRLVARNGFPIEEGEAWLRENAQGCTFL